MPRMDSAQSDSIANPAKGLMIYNIEISCLQVNDGTTDEPIWNCISGVNNLADNDGDGVKDVIDADPNDPCIPAQDAGYDGFDATNPIWLAADCDGDGDSNEFEFNCGADPYNVDESCANIVLQVSSPTYQGVSVINSRGIGYNGEAVPAASTIKVRLTNNSNDPIDYTLTATDATTGLTYTSEPGTIAASATNVSVTLNNNQAVIPALFKGNITMPLTGASNMINLQPRIDVKSIPASETVVNPVTYGDQIWMDRNLGARRAGTSRTDQFAIGSYFQWGRPSDGHEIYVFNGSANDLNIGRGLSNTTPTQATSDFPNIPNFITRPNAPAADWRSTNTSRWVNAPQGPCPTGYSVPSRTQWETADALAHPSNNNNGWSNYNQMFASSLKLTTGSSRLTQNGIVSNRDNDSSSYWASRNKGTNNVDFFIGRNTQALVKFNANGARRSYGMLVRCIKN